MKRNLFSIYTAHALNGLFGVAAVPLCVKALGLTGYGLFSIYTLLAAYVLLADIGISKNLLRLLAQARDPQTRIGHMRLALGLYIILCGAWTAALPLLVLAIPRYVFPVPPQYLAAVRWATVLAVAEFALGVPCSLMQTACVAERRFDAYAAFTVASGLSRSLTMIGAALLFRSPVPVAVALSIRKLLDLALARRLMGGVSGAWSPIFDLRGFRRMLAESGTLSAAQVLYATAMNLGAYLVNAFFGLHWLGIYRSAYDLAGKVAFLSNGISLALFPRAAEYFADTTRLPALTPVLRSLIWCSWTVYACLGAVGALAAPYALPLVGLRDSGTVSLFVLLAIGMSLNAHTLLSNEWIQAAGRYGYNICVSACLLISLGLLFFALLPAAGARAIGWAWIGAALLSGCLADGLLLTICAVPVRRLIPSALGKAAVAALCAGLAAWRFHFIGGAAAALCLAVLAVLLVSALAGVRRAPHAAPVPTWA